MQVKTKSLENNLSLYLRRVRSGETVTVTDRGVPIAERRAIAPGAAREEAGLHRLPEEGLVTLGEGRAKPFTAVRLKGGAALSNAVLDGRG